MKENHMTIGPPGNFHVGHQACTEGLGMGGTQNAIQRTKPHPDICFTSHIFMSWGLFHLFVDPANGLWNGA